MIKYLLQKNITSDSIFAIKFFLINVMNLTEYENYTLIQYKFDEDFFNITYKHLDIESTEYDNEIIFFCK
jgi:hypothetical protein